MMLMSIALLVQVVMCDDSDSNTAGVVFDNLFCRVGLHYLMFNHLVNNWIGSPYYLPGPRIFPG